MRNILITTISFVNENKKGSEIYTKFANRLVNDVITKTPYDILVTTNRPNDFNLNNKRVIVRDEQLHNHKVQVHAFNQLLKFSALKNIDKKYDWVLYLDCDAGFTTNLDIDLIEKKLDLWESKNYDMLALRTDLLYEEIERKYLETKDSNKQPLPIFNGKFKLYGINPEWRSAKLPSEHLLLLKNNEKLETMAKIFEDFCFKFESQDPNNIVTFDMEAFEIGVSAFLAKYNVGNLSWVEQNDLLKVGFNYNNWEKLKF
jgi:hypothetical protein